MSHPMQAVAIVLGLTIGMTLGTALLADGSPRYWNRETLKNMGKIAVFLAGILTLAVLSSTPAP